MIDGAVSGNMDLGDILGDAVFAGVTAGLTAGIDLNSTFGIEFGEGATTGLLGMGNNLSVANILERGLDNLISSGLSAAVYDTNFGDSFASAMTSSLVNLAMADVQYAIGEIGVTRDANGSVTHDPNWEGSPGHAILHGLAGCAAAELQGADCAAGAAGAVAQSLYAGTLSAPNREHYASEEDYAQAYASWERTTLNTAELIGGTVGFLFSAGETQNVSIAANVAQSGAQNNYLNHTERALAMIYWRNWKSFAGARLGPGQTLARARGRAKSGGN